MMGPSFPQRRVHLRALKLLLQFGLRRGVTQGGGIQCASFPKAVTSGLENTTQTPDPHSPWLTFSCLSIALSCRIPAGWTSLSAWDSFLNATAVILSLVLRNLHPCGLAESAPLWCWIPPRCSDCYHMWELPCKSCESAAPEPGGEAAEPALLACPRVMLMMQVQGPMSCRTRKNLPCIRGMWGL